MPPATVHALFDRLAKQPDELPLIAGRIIIRVRHTDDFLVDNTNNNSDDGTWWSGVDSVTNRRGIFPSNMVMAADIDVGANAKMKNTSGKRVGKSKEQKQKPVYQNKNTLKKHAAGVLDDNTSAIDTGTTTTHGMPSPSGFASSTVQRQHRNQQHQGPVSETASSAFPRDAMNSTIAQFSTALHGAGVPRTHGNGHDRHKLSLRQYNQHTNHYYTVNNAPIQNNNHGVTTTNNNTNTNTSNILSNSHTQDNHATMSHDNRDQHTASSNTTTSTNIAAHTQANRVEDHSFVHTTNTSTSVTNGTGVAAAAAASWPVHFARRIPSLLVCGTWRLLISNVSWLLHLFYVPVFLVPFLSSIIAAAIMCIFGALISLLFSFSSIQSVSTGVLRWLVGRWFGVLGTSVGKLPGIGWLWKCLFSSSLSGGIGTTASSATSTAAAAATTSSSLLSATWTATVGGSLWTWIPFSYFFNEKQQSFASSSSSSTSTTTPVLFPPDKTLAINLDDPSALSAKDIEQLLRDTWYIRQGGTYLAAEPILKTSLQQAQQRVDLLKQSISAILRDDTDEDEDAMGKGGDSKKDLVDNNSNHDITFLTNLLATLNTISVSFSEAQAAVMPVILRHHTIEDDIIAMVTADRLAALNLYRQMQRRNASVEAVRKQKVQDLTWNGGEESLTSLTPKSTSTTTEKSPAWGMENIVHVRGILLHVLSLATRPYSASPPAPPYPSPTPITPRTVLSERLKQWKVILETAKARRILLSGKRECPAGSETGTGNGSNCAAAGLLSGEVGESIDLGRKTCEAYWRIHKRLVVSADAGAGGNAAAAEVSSYDNSEQHYHSNRQAQEVVILRHDMAHSIKQRNANGNQNPISDEQHEWLEMLDALAYTLCGWGEEFLEWQHDKRLQVIDELSWVRKASRQQQILMQDLMVGKEDGEEDEEGGGDNTDTDRRIVGAIEVLLMRETRHWLDMLRRHWLNLDDIDNAR